MDKLNRYMESNKYLPKCMRDFHEQKDIFKRIQELVDIRNEKDGKLSYTRDINWVSAHVYTIDCFLWFMAANGYTLQRSRKKIDFCSLDETMEIFKDKQAEMFKKFMAENKD